jgi:hypothetical protein
MSKWMRSFLIGLQDLPTGSHGSNTMTRSGFDAIFFIASVLSFKVFEFVSELGMRRTYTLKGMALAKIMPSETAGSA